MRPLAGDGSKGIGTESLAELGKLPQPIGFCWRVAV